MNVAKELLHKIGDPSLGASERAHARCELARRLEEAGDYEGARRALGELWSAVGVAPVVGGLDERAAAEVLLRAGVLTGWIGCSRQIRGAQEAAKNLISRSLMLFEAFGDGGKMVEAQTELAFCYWRGGEFDEARVFLKVALSKLTDGDARQRAVIALRRAVVESSAGHLDDAMRVLTEAAPLFEESGDHALAGKFHKELAFVLKNLGTQERREDYTDRALVEYAAAGHHFELAGHARHQAHVEHNLASLLFTVGRHVEAHEHLDRAQALFTTLKDAVRLAQIDMTRARLFCAEGRAAEAEKLLRPVVRNLEEGGEDSPLAEALTTQGAALARLGRPERARLVLRAARVTARRAGDAQGAGVAALTAIEELGEHLSDEELAATYEDAAELLDESLSADTRRRLAASARRALLLATAQPAPADWKNFSFKKSLRRFEARLIERALRDAGGSVTNAARLLGFKHHHSLASIINNRHPDLLSERRPVVSRRRSLFAEQGEVYGEDAGASRVILEGEESEEADD